MHSSGARLAWSVVGVSTLAALASAGSGRPVGATAGLGVHFLAVGLLLWHSRALSTRALVGWRLLAGAAWVVAAYLLAALVVGAVPAAGLVTAPLLVGLLVAGGVLLAQASGAGPEIRGNLIDGTIAVLAALALLATTPDPDELLVAAVLAVPALVVGLSVVVVADRVSYLLAVSLFGLVGAVVGSVLVVLRGWDAALGGWQLVLLVAAACTSGSTAAAAGRAASRILPEASTGVTRWSSTVVPTLAGVVAVLALLLADERDLLTHGLAVVALVLWALSGWLRGRAAVGLAAARWLADSDDLTGLPNRRRLGRDLTMLLDDARPAGLVLLDLDDFKTVNDTLGHPAGDELLREVARVLRELVGSRATLYRLGGDEFVVLVPGAGLTEATALAADVSTALRAPISIQDVRLRTRASLGVACLPEHGRTAVEVMQRADQAMYLAKKAVTSTRIAVAEHGPAHEGVLHAAFELGRSLGPDGPLEVRYRPVMSPPGVSARVVAVDVQVTWHRVDREVSGAELETVALAGRLTSALTDAVADRLVADLAAAVHDICEEQRGQLSACPPVVLPISPTDLTDSRLGVRLRRPVERGLPTRWPRPRLGVAVTEDAVMANSHAALPAVRALRGAGFEVHLTRFGTGRSSLARLREMPLTAVRLDPVLLRHDPAQDLERSRRFLAATSDLAHGLGMQVVAEGVDDEATLALVTGTGVDGLQGCAVGDSVDGPGLLGLLLPQDVRR